MAKKWIEVDEVERWFPALWRIANKIPTPERFVFGHAHTLLSRVSHANVESAGLYLRLQRALDEFLTHGESESKEWVRESAANLKTVLKTLPGQDVDSGEIRAAVSQLDRLHQWLDEPPVRIPRPLSVQPPKSELFDMLDDLASSNPDLRDALQRFKNALLRGDDLRNASDSLKAGIHGAPHAKRLQANIESLTLRALAQLPGAEADVAILRFYRAFGSRPLNDPLRHGFEQHVRQAINRRPDLWKRIGDWVARKTPAVDVEDARKRLVEPLRNLLAELVARDAPLYTRLFRDQEDVARAVAKTMGSPWEALTIHREIRASNRVNQLTSTYDDAILVVNHGTRQVILPFATQVKSGDAVSQKVLDQVHRDMTRESMPDFKIEVNQVLYTVFPGPTPPVRVVITTVMPEVLPEPRIPKAGEPKRSRRPVLLEELRDAARGKPRLNESILRFEESYRTFEPAVMQTAADELKELAPPEFHNRIQGVADQVLAGQGVEFIPLPTDAAFLDRLAELMLAANGKMKY